MTPDMSQYFLFSLSYSPEEEENADPEQMARKSFE